ncbi:MAG TPA: hypothetical protein VEH05_10425 [Streptosporangiaceae bacterium]|nr:hypothetical protein [Streptosporangiaceae bacterium]
MPSGADRWAELSSQNERVVRQGDEEPNSARPAGAGSGWAELASQTERVVDASDPLFRRPEAYHGPAGMRLVAGAA